METPQIGKKVARKGLLDDGFKSFAAAGNLQKNAQAIRGGGAI